MENLCVSPNEKGIRCKNNRIGDSMFCEMHSCQFKGNYCKFKTLEQYLEQYLLKNPMSCDTKIPNLLKIYDLLNKSYKMRVQYREKAFMPETWDIGHDLKIRYVYNQLSYCENILEKKFQEEKKEMCDSDESDDESLGDSSSDSEDEKENKKEKDVKKTKKIQRKIYYSRMSKAAIAAKWNDELDEYLLQENLKRQKTLDEYVQLDIEGHKKLELPYQEGFFNFVVSFNNVIRRKLYCRYGMTVVSEIFETKKDSFELNNSECAKCAKCIKNFKKEYECHVKSPKHFKLMYDIYCKLIEKKIEKIRMRLFLYKYQEKYNEYKLWFYDLEESVIIWSQTCKKENRKMPKANIDIRESCQDDCCSPKWQISLPTFDSIKKVDLCLQANEKMKTNFLGSTKTTQDVSIYDVKKKQLSKLFIYNIFTVNKELMNRIYKFTRHFSDVYIPWKIEKKRAEKVT